MAKETPGTAVAPAVPRFDDDVLRNVQTVDDALELLRAQFGDQATVTIDDELGTGFALADDKMKDSLVGVPMLLLYWAFNQGDYRDADGNAQDFVTVALVTEDGRKIIVNDGSTGICAQLWELTDRSGRQNGLIVKRGLRKSEYRIGVIDGRKGPVPKSFEGPTEPASTFYLDTSS